ncbi:MAG: NADH-quinone oxidoreductase subunit I [Proteobacteria bacterium]|nr:NADH-quinone oxidoreductase subunit I [Pseudomonadota bacterium]
MINYFKEILGGLWTLLVGMKLTAKYAFAPTVTCHYPFETLPISPNFRGHTDLVIDPQTAGAKCIVCMMCQNTCPSQCITVAGEKPEGSKKKVLTKYHLDFTKCSLCGNCVEVCPTSALEYSQEYQLAGFSRHDFHFDLLARLRDRVNAQGIVPQPKEPAAEGEAEAKPRKVRPKPEATPAEDAGANAEGEPSPES